MSVTPSESQHELPKAWSDLFKALEILVAHRTSDISPFACEHDELHVMADDTTCTPEELRTLDELGFTASKFGGFHSFRYGSA